MKTMIDKAASIRTIMMKRWIKNLATSDSLLAAGTCQTPACVYKSYVSSSRSKHSRGTGCPQQEWSAILLYRVLALFPQAPAHLMNERRQSASALYCASLKYH